MKIINVTPGIIAIPPNGWGAVEKIIWENHNNLLALGHESQITYLDDIPSDADIVHIHVANLANMAYERGIPYYFTFHDHHAYLYGKESDLYKENFLAMQRAVKAFVPAKYLVEYFQGVPEYLSHGVNTLQFYPPNERHQHKLLCVANNGYAYDQTIDRKGFGIAIEVAKRLNLPITIAGPSNNKHYFNKYPSSYDKLNILYDLTEAELLTTYKNHSIFLHPSELEAGHPNLTLLEALSCGLPIIGTFEPNTILGGMKVTDRNIDEIVTNVLEVIEKYQEYSSSARKQATKLDWNKRTEYLLSIYTNDRRQGMKQQLLHHYQTTTMLKAPTRKKLNFNCIDGMFTEVLGGHDTRYNVKFINKKDNTVMYETDIGKNCWARTNTKYYVDWKVEVRDKKSNHVDVFDLNLQDNRVYIALDSKSLGDTLAWIPYVEEFRKKHNCIVICSTFWNNLFIEEYPEISFVNPGDTVHHIVAMYQIGLFYNSDGTVDMHKHPNNPTEIPLQQIASNILGLSHREIRPRIKQPVMNNRDSKQVAIAIHSTAQAKYWNNPLGWQTVVNWLKEKGYTVKLMSQEHDGYMGNKNPVGVEQFPPSSIDDVIGELKRSTAFIGISSGLSWLSWAVGVPTVMISGFTNSINEMEDCIRVSAPKNKCSGCWSRHKFNPGDWNWCPDHKGTPRQFECSREITAESVIRELEKIL